ncbi:2-keto-4-pentenoate hydratase/2-oxohepta-3-ene-1,7-dioic acid hydratase (catechol pathway) [Cohnella sp. OV330]|uniref:fumarylacetoacetate hydrolase family protein n=1 Tax=Cohnella sp. OV330 TaxID=1855288 RepID=UPI0008E44284|nr:fumarylacetoacetate hydrolase family protein [Cohnella sp. OV330]SFB29319.1 2-keto-4-pentenoate hydratase/2-oxohepta-3-ene-1,7-dioic acid hydratase (catechol pathway) [Cohnella sp. OV330]
MRFVTIREDRELALGILRGEEIVHLRQALEAVPAQGVPADVMDLIRGGKEAVAAVERYIERLPAGPQAYLRQENDVRFGPCVTNPGKIICIGLNYRKHAEESNAPIPEYPILFNKFGNTLAAHGDDIPLANRVTSEVDYEAELAIVIGRNAKYVGQDEALDYVFGYCCVNDLSARDLQMRTQQWLLGKSLDKFSPLGPYLVTADEVGDPNALAMRSIVNGEVRQNSNTSDMIFPCDEIVSYVSQHMTLYPGDVILTGTPEGVVLGLPKEERVYLKHGDIVTIEIEKLGSLTNRLVDE